MEECNVKTLSTLSWSFVYKFYTFALQLCKSILNAILNGKSKVVDTLTLLLDEFSDCALRICALKKLQLGLANLKECSSNLLVCNLLNGVAFKTKNLLIVRDSLFQRFNGYAKMLNM